MKQKVNGAPTEGQEIKELPLLLTTAQASDAWGVSQPTIRRWVREGKIKPYGGMKSWRFEFDDVRRALERI